MSIGHRLRRGDGSRRRTVSGAHGREEGDSHRVAGGLTWYGRGTQKSAHRPQQTPSDEPSKWATRWIIVGVLLFLLAGAWRLLSGKLDAAPVVEIAARAAPSAPASAPEGVVLNATGYIVAAHKIELAAKVIGKVNWIGVDKGDQVKEGQVLVRLEDDEYQAQLQQAKGQLANLQAKLAEALHGSRPEEIAQAQADLDSAKADLDNAKVTLDRAKKLMRENLTPKQSWTMRRPATMAPLTK